MNKTGNKQLVFEPFIKREKNGSKSIQPPAKPTIFIYKDSFNAWHCDIDINGYKYGALRHDKKEIETFAEVQIRFNSSKGIELIRK